MEDEEGKGLMVRSVDGEWVVTSSVNFNLQSKNLNRQHLCELTKNYFTLFHIFFSFYSKIPIKTHKEYTVSSHKTFSHFSLPVTPCVPLVTRKPGLLAHSVDMSVSVSHRYEPLQPLPQSAQHRPLSAEALPLDNHSQSPPPFSSPGHHWPRLHLCRLGKHIT